MNRSPPRAEPVPLCPPQARRRRERNAESGPAALDGALPPGMALTFQESACALVRAWLSFDVGRREYFMWKCTQCNESIEDLFDSCWKCGTGRDGSPPPAKSDALQKEESEEEEKKEQHGHGIKYEIHGVPGFEGRIFSIIPATLVSFDKLALDGKVIRTGYRPVSLMRKDGREVKVSLKSHVLAVPSFVVDGQTFTPVKPPSALARCWCAAPFGLGIVFGPVGFFCGLVAAYCNSLIFRGRGSLPRKVLLSGIVFALATTLSLILWSPTRR